MDIRKLFPSFLDGDSSYPIQEFVRSCNHVFRDIQSVLFKGKDFNGFLSLLTCDGRFLLSWRSESL